jgi:type I restriction enzyme, S subunit
LTDTKAKNLPTGWKWVELGEIADAVRGITFPSGEGSTRKFENSIACLTTSGVQNEVNWKSRRFVPAHRLSNQKQILQKDDLLVSTANSKELVGKSCLVNEPPYECTFGAFVTVIRPKAQVEPSLLAYWMRTSEILRWCFYASSNTTNISNLRVSELLTLRLPLPQPEEQKHIAAILEKADRLRRTRRYAQQLSDTFLQSVFFELFGDLSENSRNFPLINLCEGLRLIGGYAFESRDFCKTGIPLIRIGNANKGTMDLSNLVYLPKSFKSKLSKFLVRPKDLVITLTGTVGKDDYGNICIVSNKFNEWFLNQRVAKIEIINDLFSKEFILHGLRQSKIKSRILNKDRGIRQANISNSDILDLALPLPPKHLKDKFSRIAQRFEHLRAQQREATRQAEHLFQTLLHRAFRGEL